MAGEIKYGMVGGSMSAFIGEVHRKAIAFDQRVSFAAGCFSGDAGRNAQTGEAYGIDKARVYATYQEMADKEGSREDGIDFVSITTPNSTHYDIAKAFLNKGIHVVCEKPLCFSVAQAEELVALSRDKGLLFGVTYTYSGYTMVKVMKEMVEKGKIGNVVAVNAEYAQDWLLDTLGKEGDSDVKLSIWRTNPEFSGIANCVGDIGTHIENTVHYVTGLKIKRLSATMNKYGKELELNANMLIEYDNGINGAYWCTQVAAGKLNGLRVRVYGELGSLEWEQHFPDYVQYTPKGQATQLLSRGTGYIAEEAAAGSRLPAGHPEGLYVAFANIYKNFVSALIKTKNGETLSKADLDFPSVEDGMNGVRFVSAVVKSASSDSVWVEPGKM